MTRCRLARGVARAALPCLLLACVAVAKPDPAPAAERPAATVERWLVRGPVPNPPPAFHDAEGATYGVAELLGETQLDPRADARAGDALEWVDGRRIAWEARAAGPGGALELAVPGGAPDVPAVAWTAVYLVAERWVSAELVLRGSHPRRAWLDGEPIATSGDEPADEVKADLKLTPGRHLLFVRTVRDPTQDAPWTIGAALRAAKEGQPAPAVTSTVEARRAVELRDVLDAPTVSSIAVSPDGQAVAVGVKRTVPGTAKAESWIELRDARSGEVVRSWRGAAGAQQVAWSPDGRYLSYVATAAGSEDGKASSLYLLEGGAGEPRALLEAVPHLQSYLWAPDGRTIAYSVEVEPEKDERGVKLLEGLMDRWKDYRKKQYLHVVRVPGGAHRRITAGDLTATARDFSPDGRRLLFSRTVEALERRPYARTELWELDLERFESRKLHDFGWLTDARYAPDGKRLLLLAGAAELDGSGLDVDEGTIPNTYDGQLFIWTPGTAEVDAITRGFDPAVQAARWSAHDGRIYLVAAEGDRQQLYRYDPQGRSFTRVPAVVDVLESGISLAARAPVLVGEGTSAWRPQTLVRVDLASGEAGTLAHPAGDWFRDVEVGTVRDWSFDAASGRRIDGRVYLPPGFDAGRKYPCIVYYYGGTTPVERDFGGRYPKEWWASNGYVVYVLQPSGAIGYGQRFSARHVNDWGHTTSEEILEGTRKFLDAHPFVDRARVGCIGASYGGFMTMLLATKTDLFAAAVSHAGISSLASYWGEGYWGYSYSSVATADSFPWNRPDIYVDRSPLFRADESRVPILLTHGTSDTNVPVGESDAFYVALKLLGKDVEYLQVEGQDHWILDRKQREIWSNSIVAWFDRWLKTQPEWWDALYE